MVAGSGACDTLPWESSTWAGTPPRSFVAGLHDQFRLVALQHPDVRRLRARAYVMGAHPADQPLRADLDRDRGADPGPRPPRDPADRYARHLADRRPAPAAGAREHPGLQPARGVAPSVVAAQTRLSG